jgi:hypothetical protein
MLAMNGMKELNPPSYFVRCAYLRESKREDGKVCTRDVVYLGSIREDTLDNPLARAKFWRRAYSQLEYRVHPRLTPEQRADIDQRIAAVVPRPD